MAQSADQSTADPEVLAYNYEHVGLAHVTLDRLDGPQVGDAAPHFTASTLEGKAVSLSAFQGRVVVLETGSATCPMYVQNIEAMIQLAGRFPDVAFLVLYTREAHPGEHIGPHRTAADKTRGARLIAEEDGERRTIVIDDLRGSAHQAYGAMFNTVHIIDASGTVVFRAMWNNPEAVEDALRRLSEGRALDDPHSAGPRPSPAARDRVLNRAGPQAVRDFAAAWPGMQHAHGEWRAPHPHPGSKTPRGPEDLYTSPPPWDIGRPQPAFLALADAGAIRGRVLDAGCGTGEHALMAAGLGLDATGVDLAPRAIDAAKEKARNRGLTARFLLQDARHLADLGETFDTVLDCGLFHIFDDADRAAYVASLRAVVRPGGRYFMLGFSDQQPGQWGPRRLTRDEIETAFADGWRVDSIEPATIDITTDPDGIRAWLVALTRDLSLGKDGTLDACESPSMPVRTESAHPEAPALRTSPERNVMLTAEAHVETDRASRHLVHLCRHASKMGRHLGHRPRTHGGGDAPPEVQHVEWSDTHGTVRFGWGQCILQATPDALTLRAEATDEVNLRRLQDGVARRLETLGRRDQLTVTWNRPAAPTAHTAQPGEATSTAPTPTGQATARRGHGRTIGLAAVGALAVALHLGLFGAALQASRWTSWGANLVVAVVLVMVIAMGVKVVVLGRFAERRSLGHLAIRRVHRRTDR